MNGTTSDGSFFRRQSVRRVKSAGGNGHPFGVPPPFRGPKNPFCGSEVDLEGYPNVQVFSPEHAADWDDRHHLNIFSEGRKTGTLRPDNTLIPKGERFLFSKPSKPPELKAHLSTLKNSKALLESLDLPEKKMPASVVSADGSPSLFPGRHKLGGTMRDRDNEIRAWNDRWHCTIASMNDHLHKSHRQYFVEKSVFEEAKSQSWRRFRDQQVAPGVWQPMRQRRPCHFKPIGV